MNNQGENSQNQEQAIWNQLASWWDQDIQEGDMFHRYLVFPYILQLAEISSTDSILDVACGNGALARIMAKKAHKVVAVDFSSVFIDKARARTNENNITYEVVDAVNEEQLLALSHDGKYDKIICSMAMHDMCDISVLIKTLKNLLKPTGCFIFSVPHPCFNSGIVELGFSGNPPHVKRSSYINDQTYKIKSKDNQPIEQICFHRSLSKLFNQFFKENMLMSGFFEPVANSSELPSDFAWKKLAEIPPAIISRWVFASK